MKIVFAIALGDDGSPPPQAKLQRLPPPDPDKPYTLRFILAAGSEALINGCLKTNYPVYGGPFERNRFSSISFRYDYITDGYCEFQIDQGGAYEYFVEYSNKGQVKTSLLPGHFLVDPALTIHPLKLDREASSIAPKEHILNLNSICLLTVVPKWLGPISTWKHHFQSFASMGYNMIHFVPLQKRGESNSPYSIYDQLSLSDDLFEDAENGKLTEEKKTSILRQEISSIHQMGMLTMSDIVWNHTANNSEWLKIHPEAGYNLVNSPHLMPAYILDEAIMQFSKNIQSYCGIDRVSSETDLNHVMDTFKEKVFVDLKLWEFYVLDVEKHLSEISAASICDFKPTAASQKLSKTKFSSFSLKEKSSIIRNECLISVNPGTRLGKRITTEDALSILSLCTPDGLNIQAWPKENLIMEYKRILEDINMFYYLEYDKDVVTIMENIRNRLKYERIADHGPKMGRISFESPLVSTYFTRIERTSQNQHFDWKELIVANNGWIWNADPLVDFAGPHSKSYLIREVIPWGDCVKLRYGRGPADNPWLWEHMTKYSLLLASAFDGFRIDNCHSTPIHVAQFFLDKARQIKPNLYVIAELFTGSEEKDIKFVSKLGINSLIREAMNAWNAGEMSRLVHHHGGQPAGSMALNAEYLPYELVGHGSVSVKSPIISAFEKPVEWLEVDKDASDTKFSHLSLNDLDESGRKTPFLLRGRSITPLKTSKADGNSDYILRHVAQTSPQVHMDDDPNEEIVLPMNGSLPHALFMDCTHDNETPYMKRTAEDTLSTSALVAMANCAVGSVKGYDELVPYHLNIVHEPRLYKVAKLSDGVCKAKQFLMYLHYVMGQKGYTELHVHHENDFVMVHRQNPFTHHGYVLIANTGFRNHCDSQISPIILRNQVFKTVMAAKLSAFADKYVRDQIYINGLHSELSISYEKPLDGMVEIVERSDDLGQFIKIEPKNFPSGSILLLETSIHNDAYNSLEKIRHLMNLNVHGAWYLDGIVRCVIPGLRNCFEALSLEEMNVVLYKADPEERDCSSGDGTYDIPGYGPLPYAGLQGFASLLRPIALSNDLGHPLCANLRAGFWALDYIMHRIQKYTKTYPNLSDFAEWLKVRLEALKKLPNFLIPKYFNIIVMSAYREALYYSYGKMSTMVKAGSKMVRALAMGAVQMYGKVPSTGLTPIESTPSISAGLPHFTTHHMRCWGRDIFICLPGLFLSTGLFEIAKAHILNFASCVKHGLIPNLLDAGRRPRYNARDAAWWFLHAIKRYCEYNESTSILDETIKRRFPSDEFVDYEDSKAYSTKSTIREVMFEILKRHACGIRFVEWNAGPNLDHAMTAEGFNIEIKFDPNTGLIFGGNRMNCGTWMDKMGDSGKAGTRGFPATPRDGAAVEIIGLLKAVVFWVSKLAKNNLFPSVVTLQDGKSYSFDQWNSALQTSFEKCFYIPKESSMDSNYMIDSKIVNVRGIYKDTYKSSLHYTDYQLRPNFVVAMALAPELFDPVKAREALEIVRQRLLSKIGMKTLDPSDWSYRGDYDNDNDSDDPSIAKGFNYHQGPEWVWPVGYFLKAYYLFNKTESPDWDLTHKIHSWTRPQKTVLFESPFAGLPELTNSNGALCPHSCATQAWSMATFLEVIHDLRVEVERSVPQQ